MTTRISVGQHEALMLLASEQPDPAIQEQMALVTTYEGPATMARLDVPSSGRVRQKDGPCPSAIAVVDGSGELVGELILWIANGRIETVEQTWYSAESPKALPSRESVATYGDLGFCSR
ncbi:hypothetical protein nbrc107696_19510 [Gordonia spumicola]|uniref:Uncharacterized protein n=1 Tax=Gordonia spumicola TaxID=589161 RepID=A0A7I9V7Z9_9ACTN|nr:hypothetical protein nbrc107696_19510 [Gordonia spumicola]